MAQQLFSPLWYRVSDLKPKLRGNVRMHAHIYRGRTWHVLEDEATGRSHRFTAPARHFIGLMDGERNVEKIWQLSEDAYGDEAPTQDEAIELLSKLHAADLLQTNVPPAVDELFSRYRKRNAGKWKQRLASPLAIRIPLVDPNAFLDRYERFVNPLFGRTALFAWLTLVTAAVIVAGVQWPELSDAASMQLINPTNAFLLWLTYPIVKLLHELGHAFAAKRWGCEVHEMGIMLLVLFPLPYVDASTSAALPERRARMAIAAMGIIVELAIASLALMTWIAVEPGTIRDLAYSILLISGISTLLFNGNPLLRFDGYFVFADLIEIPNLGTRSKEYFAYLVRSYLFGVADERSPAMSADERKWLAGYAIAAFLFRLSVLFTIILFVAGKFFVIGLVLAAWAAVTQILMPLLRQVRWLLTDQQLERRRGRAVGITAATLAAVLTALLVAPAPLVTRTDGVVWSPDDAEVRAGADAMIERLLAEPGTLVTTGDPLLLTHDPELPARAAVLRAELREAYARYSAARGVQQVDADNLMEEIRSLEAELADAQARIDSLTIRAPTDGAFLVDRPQDLPGRFLRKGELIGFVADLSTATVRVAIPQADMGLIRTRTERVDVRFADHIAEALPAIVGREVPAASNRLPSAALGNAAGGLLPIDPTDEEGIRTLEAVFHLELEIDRPVARIGGRTYVRFDHGHEPLGFQWYRRLRQLLLRQFDA